MILPARGSAGRADFGLSISTGAALRLSAAAHPRRDQRAEDLAPKGLDATS